jgi:CDP-glycerol glycerophosphotransferase
MISQIKKLAAKNKLFANLIYICFRTYGVLFYILFWIADLLLPKKQNKIVCCNMKGKRYGDNPKYITDNLLQKKNDLDIVWLLNNTMDREAPRNIRIVKYDFWHQIYELSTAKVWIDSNTKQYGFKKRKKQLYVQTWHGSYGLKKIGADLGDKISKIDICNHKYNSKNTDIMVSNSTRTSEIYRKAFWYQGEILQYGSPRNDIFFKDNEDIKNKVNKYFNLDGRKIVIYAPTFRADYRVSDLNINYNILLQSLSERFGGEWVVLVRLHPNNLEDAKNFIQYTDKIINASEYDIMQELLVASDVLVTDYSSCMFDFVTNGKPCFLYASDRARYKEERDNYYELEDLPFPVATNEKELKEVINEFDADKYREELNSLFEEVGLNETGHASEIVADYILKWMKEH